MGTSLRARRAGAGPAVAGRWRSPWRRGALLLLLGLAGAAPESAAAAGDAGVAAFTGAPSPSSDPGRALRRAMQAVADGDRSLAEERLVALARQAPFIADFADLQRVRLRFEAGAFPEAIALGEAWSHPSSPLAGDLAELLGDAYAAMGQGAAARAAWDTAFHAAEDRARRASLLLRIADSYAAEGDLAGAEPVYLELWRTLPLQAEAQAADAALDRIALQRGRDARDAGQYRRRGDVFFRRRRNEQALADYERTLAFRGMPPSAYTRARRGRAHTLFRLRRYTEAARALGELPPTPENRIERARAFARAGDVPRGIRELEAVAREHGGSHGARARFLAALLVDGEGDDARARQLFEQVIRSSGGSAYGKAALWRLGWSDFRERRLDAAAKHFEKIIKAPDDALAKLRARYWLARTRELARNPAARADFEALAREFPLDYYGWRARLRLEHFEPGPPPRPIDPGTAALDQSQLARPRVFLAAGLEPEARRELERLYGLADGLEDRLALASLYASIGDFNHTQRLIVSAYNESLARGLVPAQIDLWWYAWPAPFQAEMRRATDEGSLIEPGLVYALMREESGYQPDVMSAVGARGLMQIMPETGERLARQVGLAPYDAERLFDPAVNIQLGSTYLADLLRRFDGQTSAAIASYNAGPAAVSRWLDAGVEDDEWVEAIPYDETRAYVKRVLRSLHLYRVLY